MSKGNGTTTIELEEPAPVDFEELAERVAETIMDAIDEEPAAEATPVDPDAAPETLSRYVGPSTATRDWLAKQLKDRLQEIEGGIWDDGGVSWNGVRVITAADLLNVLSLPLPEPSAFSSEARSGGLLTVWTHCPGCGIANPVHVDIGAELKITDEGDRKLKPTFKVEARAHACGQLVVPLKAEPPVEGQTEAFPEETEELTPAVVGKLLDAVADILPDAAPVELPDDEVIAGWTPEQLATVAAWARAVIAGEGPYPEQPAEVTPAEPDQPADA